MIQEEDPPPNTPIYQPKTHVLSYTFGKKVFSVNVEEMTIHQGAKPPNIHTLKLSQIE